MAVQEIKICLLGDSGVGKSSIVRRFVNNTFNPTSESTIGASFMTKNVVLDGFTFKFNIWDTAGQERYRALAPMYYRGAGASIIVYDITQNCTFAAVKSWVRELQLHGPPSIILTIAGNKCDLDDKREVPYNVAKKYAEEIGAIFIETSALTAVNISEAFEEITKRLPRNNEPQAPNHTIHLKKEKVKKKCC
ncbi:ras-related protein Rab-22A-like [Centruroides sculpturatus]|uniref:ras-related protein Rab-22A-like n=1 Tax=Centruroides sculpturatus TaxID=218467 RepID=UPI000C6CECD7|nr:ras-related protein Rab-22A-like [Centruroides sculpturatus]XP_023220730.1 ras-related protein Rab-22A-like [Centruroides sculpturatus]